MDKTLALEYLNQGERLLGKRSYENAIHYFEMAEKEDPFNIDSYIDMGVAFANLEQYDNAKNCFIKALKVNKEVGIVYFHLGNIYFLKDDKSKGMQYYNQAIGKGYEGAQMYFSLGLMFEEEGDSLLAIRNYSKAILLDSLRADARIRKARIFIRNKQYPEAIQTLDEMIMACPDIFEGYHLKFEVLLTNGEFEKAGQVLDKARKLFPNDLGFILDQAELYSSLKQYEEALALLEEAEKRDQGGLDKHGVAMERARISALTGDMEHTIRYLNEAKRISAEREKPYFDAEASFFLMNCYINVENYTNALDCSRELKAEESSGYYHLSAYYYEPYCLQRLQRSSEAMGLLQSGAEALRSYSLKNPGNTDCYFFRIMCLKDLKQYDKALELADYLLMIKEVAPEVHTLRAVILTEMGREEEAKKEKAKARELGGVLEALPAIQS
ncbi:MAG: hypothetical protein K0R34_261 [Herbinix sp.]|jgi:tetratricopeptide (TPR) repeat protein|nr:hypothetical protein [Herbinix sp.]